MQINIYTKTKDTQKYKVNVNFLYQLINLYNRGGQQKDQNHNNRQAEERREKTNQTKPQRTQYVTTPQQYTHSSTAYKRGRNGWGGEGGGVGSYQQTGGGKGERGMEGGSVLHISCGTM